MTLIMSALFLGQGVSVAAAMCRHGSADAHATARDSRDGSISAAALAEETAASVVEKKGAWLQFKGELIGQGKDAARQTLAEKPELAQKIIAAIMEHRQPVAAQNNAA